MCYLFIVCVCAVESVNGFWGLNFLVFTCWVPSHQHDCAAAITTLQHYEAVGHNSQVTCE